MISTRLTTALALGVLGSAALAGQASAATKTVYAGPNAKTADELAINRFYPQKVSIHVGDSVAWEYRGFHNIYVPKKGAKPPADIAPDPSGAKYEGLTGPDNNPLWLNGMPVMALTAGTALPTGGSTYDGTADVGSGLPLGEGPPKPYKVQFTKQGDFTYYCTLHRGMKAQVKVLPKSASTKAANRQEARRAAKDLKKDLATAKRLNRIKPKKNIITASDRPPVNWLKFYPSKLTVKAGSTVTFENAHGQEPHTLSWAASDDFLKQITNQTTLAFDGRVIFPSDPGKTLPPFDGTNHGGFYSTGVIGNVAGVPKKAKFKVTKAGKYTFYCLIHPEMKVDLTVK